MLVLLESVFPNLCGKIGMQNNNDIMENTMNSFVGFFSKEQPPASHFEKTPLFDELRPLLKILFDKEDKLKTDALNDSKREKISRDTLSQSKYARIHDLCDKIRQAIDEYNRPCTTEDDQNMLKVTLIHTLEALIDNTLLYDRVTLGLHRQVKERANARNGIRITTTAATVAGGAVSSVATGSIAGVLIGVGCAAVGVSKAMSEGMINYLGLIDETTQTATIYILTNLQKKIAEIKQSPEFNKYSMQYSELKINTDDRDYRI